MNDPMNNVMDMVGCESDRAYLKFRLLTTIAVC